MKSNVATVAFLLLCIIIFGIGMNACGGTATRNRFEYTERNLDAKIYGKIDGNEVTVTLKSRPNATEGESNLTLIYKSPAAFSGLVLSQNTSGIFDARLGELIMQDFKADGLVEPFLTLLSPGEISSIVKDRRGNTTVFVKQNEIDLEYLFPKGQEYPQSIKGRISTREIELFIQSLDFV